MNNDFKDEKKENVNNNIDLSYIKNGIRIYYLYYVILMS